MALPAASFVEPGSSRRIPAFGTKHSFFVS
jgi:hypothetical protein